MGHPVFRRRGKGFVCLGKVFCVGEGLLWLGKNPSGKSNGEDVVFDVVF
jgi:hypothetical protein